MLIIIFTFVAVIGVVVMPALLVTGLKYKIAPPAWSKKMVKVNMWHNELVIPRAHLKAWSLVNVVRNISL